MARVNRTTGFFLLLGVLALIGTVAGSMKVMQHGAQPTLPAPAADGGASVFAAGNVDVATGLSNLVPNVMAGKVTTVFAKEGDVVKAGQALVQLDDSQPRKQLEVAEQALKVAQAKLEGARKLAQDQITEYELKVLQQKTLVSDATAAYNAAHSKWKQAQDARVKGLLNRFEEDNAEHLMILAKTRMGGAEAVLQKLQSVDPKLNLKEHEEALKEADLKVKAARDLLGSYVIKAPADGQIFEVNYQVGGSAPLPPTDPNSSRALIFCPNEGLVLRAELDQEWAMLVRPGMKATLTFQAAGHDYEWAGTVQRVANYIQPRRSRVMEPGTFNDSRTRECIIRITPNPNVPISPLPGMRMRVQIHTN